jgi:integrase
MQKLGRYKKDIGPVFKFKSVHDISHKFKAYADMAMLTGCRFHDLRHTYASHLAMAGEDLKSIQELMRHRSIASTMVVKSLDPVETCLDFIDFLRTDPDKCLRFLRQTDTRAGYVVHRRGRTVRY